MTFVSYKTKQQKKNIERPLKTIFLLFKIEMNHSGYEVNWTWMRFVKSNPLCQFIECNGQKLILLYISIARAINILPYIAVIMEF